nr:putative receptor-like protein kinase At4g00960 [Tanacetum cinerariifolium]
MDVAFDSVVGIEDSDSFGYGFDRNTNSWNFGRDILRDTLRRNWPHEDLKACMVDSYALEMLLELVLDAGELKDGTKIADKRLANNFGKGDPEFKNEVLLVVKLQHLNLVRLLGFSKHENERLLVYELLLNASLNQFIFDPMKHALFDWKMRYKIIKSIAEGLLYLHEDSRLKIIIRDMKVSNVLLDVEMNARIVDFDMARLFKQD